MTTDEFSRYRHTAPDHEARRTRTLAALRRVDPGALVLDVGAGDVPYRAWFAERRLLALDVAPPADLLGASERLPLRDGTVDLIVCFQVLEHVEDPAATLGEFFRVLRPGGQVLLTTHGTYPYHPHPRDLWRWTGEGLETLFRRAGFEPEVSGLGGSASPLTMLAGYYVRLAIRPYPRLQPLRRLIPALNRMGGAIDRRVPDLSDPRRAGTLFVDYFVNAVKPASGDRRR